MRNNNTTRNNSSVCARVLFSFLIFFVFFLCVCVFCQLFKHSRVRKVKFCGLVIDMIDVSFLLKKKKENIFSHQKNRVRHHRSDAKKLSSLIILSLDSLEYNPHSKHSKRSSSRGI